MGKAAYSSDDEATLYSPTSPIDDDKRDLLKTPPEKVHPVDTGLHAWLFLCASFLIEALALGFPGAFGVFQSYYSTHAPFKDAPGLPIVSTCAMGIMYLGMPITMGIQRLSPRLSIWSPLIGIFIMTGSLVAASFSTTVPHLIGTQGVGQSGGQGGGRYFNRIWETTNMPHNHDADAKLRVWRKVDDELQLTEKGLLSWTK
ncbi:hypothetical protein NQ176_g7814 [Zarea fungicola]|uniref:Uncharacterized protein n=1 Tax=Zarea fungicola TaxID=93591 RepID=A0ACC1MY93_9HYPO|nr:hypothetical protein NQ176_g7814 [Lecanicillium fungicola]